MKVKELKEILNNFPDDFEVMKVKLDKTSNFSNVSAASLITISLSVRLYNLIPKVSANLTRAISSGDDAW